MSTQNPFPSRARRAIRAVPHGEIVASFETYFEAQQAVDGLVRAEFPVDRVSIVGSDLKTIERVTGKLTWGRVALAGAASGAWLGIFLGVLFSMFSSGGGIGVIGAAVLIGAGFGMLFGVVSYAINRRRKDFTSMTQVLADRYDLIVDPSLGARARNLLDNAGVRSTAAQPPRRSPDLSRTAGGPGPVVPAPVRPQRPRYGEYLPPPASPSGPEASPPLESAGEPTHEEDHEPADHGSEGTEGDRSGDVDAGGPERRDGGPAEDSGPGPASRDAAPHKED
jgi:hypothetical protein